MKRIIQLSLLLLLAYISFELYKKYFQETKKLSSKTNLSERQMKASMASGDNNDSDSGKTGNDYVNVQQGEVSRAEMVQGQRNVAKLESTKTNNATDEKNKIEKSEKNFKKTKHYDSR